jgi:CIC family chloride channel protein
MTNDYRIILPLMFAVFVSLAVSQRLQADSVYTLGLARKGIRLNRGRDVEVLEGIEVAEVMQREPPIVHEQDELSHAASILEATQRQSLPVLNAAEELVGIITLGDIQQGLNQGLAGGALVGEYCARDLVVAYPDETLGAALRRMGARDIGRLPVVARGQPRHLVGILRRNEIVRAYEIALARREARRHSIHHAQLHSRVPPGVQVREFVVGRGAACANQRLAAVTWPRETVIVSLRRGRQVIIPRGETVLQAGDILVAAGAAEALAQLEHLCASPASA